MFIAGESVHNIVFAHYDERNTVNQTPRFVGVSFIKLKCFIEQRFSKTNDFYFVRFKKIFYRLSFETLADEICRIRRCRFQAKPHL